MKLSHSHTRQTDYKQASKQASNKKQQEAIDEGTKNSTSLPHQPLPHSHEPLLDDVRDTETDHERECAAIDSHAEIVSQTGLQHAALIAQQGGSTPKSTRET